MGGNNIWHANDATGSNPRQIEIAVDQANVRAVHTLINNYGGSAGPDSYAWVEFVGSTGPRTART